MDNQTQQIVKPRLLYWGDMIAHTGFAKVGHSILEHLQEVFEVHALGINVRGDPHPYPYPIYRADTFGNIWGLNRLQEMFERIQPDLWLGVQDSWIWAKALELDRGNIPVCCYVPCDATNQPPGACQQLNKADMVLFYTSYGEQECRRAGFTGKSEIVSHGVNSELYIPLNRDYCRARLNFSQALLPGAFIFGNVNRNSPRKRQDLSIEYFAEWVHNYHIPQNVYLYLHCAQHDTAGIDPAELAYYYGVDKRIIMPPEDSFTPAEGFPEWQMPLVYNCFDVNISTTAGEGWGLTVGESAACGTPQILPHNSALAEWMSGAAYFVPCSAKVTHPVISTIGSIPDKVPFIQALDRMYRDASLRSKYGALALQRAREPRFQWRAVADEFKRHLGKMLIDKREAVGKREADKKVKEAE